MPAIKDFGKTETWAPEEQPDVTSGFTPPEQPDLSLAEKPDSDFTPAEKPDWVPSPAAEWASAWQAGQYGGGNIRMTPETASEFDPMMVPSVGLPKQPTEKEQATKLAQDIRRPIPDIIRSIAESEGQAGGYDIPGSGTQAVEQAADEAKHQQMLDEQFPVTGPGDSYDTSAESGWTDEQKAALAKAPEAKEFDVDALATQLAKQYQTSDELSAYYQALPKEQRTDEMTAAVVEAQKRIEQGREAEKKGDLASQLADDLVHGWHQAGGMVGGLHDLVEGVPGTVMNLGGFAKNAGITALSHMKAMFGMPMSDEEKAAAQQTAVDFATGSKQFSDQFWNLIRTGQSWENALYEAAGQKPPDRVYTADEMKANREAGNPTRNALMWSDMAKQPDADQLMAEELRTRAAMRDSQMDLASGHGGPITQGLERVMLGGEEPKTPEQLLAEGHPINPEESMAAGLVTNPLNLTMFIPGVGEAVMGEGLMSRLAGRGVEGLSTATKLGGDIAEGIAEGPKVGPFKLPGGRQIGRATGGFVGGRGAEVATEIAGFHGGGLLGSLLIRPVARAAQKLGKWLGGGIGEGVGSGFGLPKMLNERVWQPVGKILKTQGEDMAKGGPSTVAKYGPAGPLIGKPIAGAVHGAVASLPFMIGTETPEERGQILGFGVGAGFAHAAVPAARDAAMSTLFFRDETRGYPNVNAAKIDYNDPANPYDQQHNAYMATRPPDEQQTMNDLRHLFPKVKIFSLDDASYNQAVTDMQNSGRLQQGPLKSRGFNIVDGPNGEATVIMRGDGGFDTVYHELGHSLYRSMSPADQRLFAMAGLRSNDPATFTRNYFKHLLGQDVEFKNLPTEAGLRNGTERELPGLPGVTQEHMIEEMGAETVKALLRGQPISTFLKDPVKARQMQMAMGRMMEKLGINMTPREATTVLGLKPSVSQMFVMDKALRDYFKANQRPAAAPAPGGGGGGRPGPGPGPGGGGRPGPGPGGGAAGGGGAAPGPGGGGTQTTTAPPPVQPQIGGGSNGVAPAERAAAIRGLVQNFKWSQAYAQQMVDAVSGTSADELLQNAIKLHGQKNVHIEGQNFRPPAPPQPAQPPPLPHPLDAHRGMTTNELVNRAASRDPQAEQALIERHGPNWLQHADQEAQDAFRKARPDDAKAHDERVKASSAQPTEEGTSGLKMEVKDAAGNVIGEASATKGRSTARVTVGEMLNAGGDSAKAAQQALDAGWKHDDPMPKAGETPPGAAEGQPQVQRPGPVTGEHINQLRNEAEAEVGPKVKNREQAVARLHLQKVMEAHDASLPSGDTRVRAKVDPETGRTVYVGTHFDPTDPVHQWLLSRMDPSEREQISAAQQSIHNEQSMHFNYVHAKRGDVHPGDVTGLERGEEYEHQPAAERARGTVEGQLGPRTMLPISVGVGADGQGLVYGMATDKILNNAKASNAAMKKAGMTLPYGELNARSAPLLADDMRKVAQNHAAGYTGDGTQQLTGTKDRPVVVDSNYVPQPVAKAKSDYINMILNARDPLEGPPIGKRGQKTAAGKAVEFAEANHGYTSPVVSGGQERTEVNPLRETLDEKGAFRKKDQRGSKQILEHGYEQFRADLMRDLREKPPALRQHGIKAEQFGHAPIRRYAAAGFHPEMDPERVTRRYKSDDLHWAPTAEVDKRWSGDKGFYIPKGGTENTIGNRYPNAQEYIRGNEKMHAPEAAVWEDGSVHLSDGRHRLAAMRDEGHKHVPLALDKESVQNAKKTGLIPYEGQRKPPASFMPMAGPEGAGFEEAEREGRIFVNPYDRRSRYEISDHDMTWKGKPMAGEVRKLGDTIDHPSLFKDYPEAKDIQVEYDPKRTGAGFEKYEGPTGRITVSDPSNKEMLIHEVQHWIQGKEGFRSGTSVDQQLYELGLDPAKIAKKAGDEYDRIASQQDDSWRFFFPDKESYVEQALLEEAQKRYHANAGEIEAREAARRAGMTPAERAATPPYSPEGKGFIPPSEAHFMPEVPEEVRLRGAGADVGKEKELRRYEGAPPGIKDSRGLGKLKDRLLQLAREGEAFRHWYREGAEVMMRGVGNLPERFERLAANIAASSPQNRVYPNAGMAVRALAQQEAGGRRITIGKGEQMKERLSAIGRGDIWEGVKTNQFYRDHMAEFDKRLQDDMGSTMDMHMARAFGYPTDSFTPKQSQWSQGITREITQELGWGRPKETQAAIWSAIKARFETVWPEFRNEAKAKGDFISKTTKSGEEKGAFKDAATELKYRNRALKKAMEIDAPDLTDAAFNFGDALKRDLGHISYETRPSTDVQAQHEWMQRMTPEDWDAYHKEQHQVLLDPDGTNKLAKATGLVSLGEHQGYSAYGSERNLSQQISAVMPKAAGETLKRAGEKFKVDPTVEHQVKDFGAAVGLLYRQDGVGYHRPYFKDRESGVTNKASNGVQIDTGGPLSVEHTRGIVDEMEKKVPSYEVVDGKERGWFVAPYENGLKVVMFGHEDASKLLGFVKDAVNDTLPDSSSPALRTFASYGGLVKNNWETNPNGEMYRRWLRARGRPDVQRLVDDTLRPQVEAIDAKWRARKAGAGEGAQAQGPQAAAHPEVKGEVVRYRPPTALPITPVPPKSFTPSVVPTIPPPAPPPQEPQQPAPSTSQAAPAPRKAPPSYPKKTQPQTGEVPAAPPTTDYKPYALAPDMEPKVRKLADWAKKNLGLDLVVLEGRRSRERAAALAGKSKAGQMGPAITNSMHIGGEAVDIGFGKSGEKGGVDRFNEDAYAKLGEAAAKFGLKWGGKRDSGHFENATYGSNLSKVPKEYLTPPEGFKDSTETAITKEESRRAGRAGQTTQAAPSSGSNISKKAAFDKTIDQVMQWEGSSDVQDGRPEIYGFRRGQDPEYERLAAARAAGDEGKVRAIVANGLIQRAYQAGAGHFHNPAVKAQIISLADLRGPGGAQAILNAVGGKPLQNAETTTVSLDPDAIQTINSMSLPKFLRRVRIAREIYDKKAFGNKGTTHGGQSGNWWDMYGAGLINRYEHERKFFSDLAG